MTNLQKAAQEYLDRKSRKEFPRGKTDSYGLWHPDELKERCECCNNVQSPTRNRPWALIRHCRTTGHIATLFGVDHRELKEKLKMTNTKQRHLEIVSAAKAVLIENDIDITRSVHILPLAKIVAHQTDCHITTAKNNVAKAVRIMRGELVTEWGGKRDGSGRPPKIRG